jgi:hypothetical protein
MKSAKNKKIQIKSRRSPIAVSSEKLTARFVVMFPQVPETESTWLIFERLEATTSVVGLQPQHEIRQNKKIHIKSRRS